MIHLNILLPACFSVCPCFQFGHQISLCNCTVIVLLNKRLCACSQSIRKEIFTSPQLFLLLMSALFCFYVLFCRKLLTECCDPKKMFAITKENSPIGKVLWYDGEIYHYHTVNNETYPLFVQVPSFTEPPKK